MAIMAKQPLLACIAIHCHREFIYRIDAIITTSFEKWLGRLVEFYVVTTEKALFIKGKMLFSEVSIDGL